MSIKPRPVPEKIRSANSNCIGPRQIQAEPAPTRLAHGWHCRGPSGRVMRRSRRTDNVDRFRPRNHSRGRRSSRSVTRRARDETCAGSSSCRHRTDDALSAMVQPLPRAVSLSTIVTRSPGRRLRVPPIGRRSLRNRRWWHYLGVDLTTALDTTRRKEIAVGTYVVTGSASGMGQATAQKLREGGHSVIGVDIKSADIVADLSTPDGRKEAADRVLKASDAALDGAVLAAGLGPARQPDRPRQIAAVNYFGVVDLLDAWRPALAATPRAKVVVFSSNSTTTTPAVPRRTVRALLAHDAEKAVRSVRLFGRIAPALMYAASKIAVSHWVRLNAVTSQWAGSGIC